jgi:hypothetical protein
MKSGVIVTGDPNRPDSRWMPWQTVDLVRNDFGLHTLVPLRAIRPGTVRGVAFAWQAWLTDEIVLSTLPDAPETHWKQGFIYLSHRIDAGIGDQFLLEISFASTYSPGVGYWTRLHYVRAAERDQFIAGLSEDLRPFVASGRTAVIKDGKPVSLARADPTV